MAYTKGMVQNLINQYGCCGFTHKESGYHYATLNALVRRGWLAKDTKGEYHVTHKGGIFARVEEYADGKEFITLRREGEKLGMLCSVEKGEIFDAWGTPYDVRDGVWVSYPTPDVKEVWIG